MLIYLKKRAARNWEILTGPMWSLELRRVFRSRFLFSLMLSSIVLYSGMILFFWPTGVLYSSEVLRGWGIFSLVCLIQLGLVLLAATATGADVFSPVEEKGRWDALRMSSVGLAGVMIPRAFSSLAGVLFFILASAPVLSVLTLAGGLVPARFFMTYAVLGLSVAAGLAIGFFNGVLWRRPSYAVTSAMVMVLIWNAPWMRFLGRSRRIDQMAWLSPLGTLRSILSPDLSGIPVGTVLFRYSFVILILILVSLAFVIQRSALIGKSQGLLPVRRHRRGKSRKIPDIGTPLFWETIREKMGWKTGLTVALDYCIPLICLLVLRRLDPRVRFGGSLMQWWMDPFFWGVFWITLLFISARAVFVFGSDQNHAQWDMLKMSGMTHREYFVGRSAGFAVYLAGFLVLIVPFIVLRGQELMALPNSPISLAVLYSRIAFLSGALAFAAGLGTWAGITSPDKGNAFLWVYGILGVYSAIMLSARGILPYWTRIASGLGMDASVAVQWIGGHYHMAMAGASWVAGLIFCALAFRRLRRAWRV
jgi:hypothetical protein